MVEEYYKREIQLNFNRVFRQQEPNSHMSVCGNIRKANKMKTLALRFPFTECRLRVGKHRIAAYSFHCSWCSLSVEWDRVMMHHKPVSTRFPPSYKDILGKTTDANSDELGKAFISKTACCAPFGYRRTYPDGKERRTSRDLFMLYGAEAPGFLSKVTVSDDDIDDLEKTFTKPDLDHSIPWGILQEEAPVLGLNIEGCSHLLNPKKNGVGRLFFSDLMSSIFHCMVPLQKEDKDLYTVPGNAVYTAYRMLMVRHDNYLLESESISLSGKKQDMVVPSQMGLLVILLAIEQAANRFKQRNLLEIDVLSVSQMTGRLAGTHSYDRSNSRKRLMSTFNVPKLCRVSFSEVLIQVRQFGQIHCPAFPTVNSGQSELGLTRETETPEYPWMSSEVQCTRYINAQNRVKNTRTMRHIQRKQRQPSGNSDAFWMRHRQPAFGQYWVMIGCCVQTFDQSDLGSMLDRQASRTFGQSCKGIGFSAVAEPNSGIRVEFRLTGFKVRSLTTEPPPYEMPAAPCLRGGSSWRIANHERVEARVMCTYIKYIPIYGYQDHQVGSQVEKAEIVKFGDVNSTEKFRSSPQTCSLPKQTGFTGNAISDDNDLKLLPPNLVGRCPLMVGFVLSDRLLFDKALSRDHANRGR
ncbi:hypothetical protein CLF_107727 [Clonorchis sinensis]|uniref:Uncharacterized protein n=1 Tax=Clonorchis sinensis TaxID=79923 RepID=G7YH37_CLOSI|nr:hypothetical protein CLF_107727 [Clonorchis sinensis]